MNQADPIRSDVVIPSEVAPESWGNGLGLTRVLAESLGWRLSIAELGERVPFSHLPGIDRILIPLIRTVSLTIDGLRHDVARTQGIRFPGEAQVIGGGADGGVTAVVNLLVDRSSATATCSIVEHHGPVQVSPSSTATVLLSGAATMDDHPLPIGAAILQSARPITLVCDRALLAHIDVEPSD